MTDVHCLANALLQYIQDVAKEGRVATFTFGVYGGALSYDNQPCVQGILQNFKLLILVLHILGSRPKPTIVKQAFKMRKQMYTVSNINLSRKYDDERWSMWWCRALLLLQQHLHKINNNSRCRR